MTTNYMLIKAPVGVHKSLPRDLPDISHSYGKGCRKDQHNVKSLLSSWYEHESTPAEPLKPDFQRMNRVAIINKVTSAKAAKSFR